MRLKKVLAAILAAVLVVACVPFAASAANDPTCLYVGEKSKTGDNLIDMLESTNEVRVYAIDKSTAAYYTLVKEKGVGYVLTFYNNYAMSEMITGHGAYCGLYCDGDLTVRIAGSVTFDANDTKYRGAFGWVVDGMLTIEGITSGAKLDVTGAKAKSTSDSGNIAISAPTVKLHNVTVNALGGYAAVKADEALVMLNSTLNANTADEMKDGEDTLFTYSIETENYIQVGGAVRADGDVNIKAFYFDGGTNQFDKKVVVYGRSYGFAEDSYKGAWTDSFTLFRDPSIIPSCMQVYICCTVGKISGNKLTLYRRGTANLALIIPCGSETIVMDSRSVQCNVMWWQWIPYILSGNWIEAWF